jgi:hypothetical protein
MLLLDAFGRLHCEEPPSTLTCNFHASKAIDCADSKVMMWRPQQKQLDSVYELYYAYCPNVLCI